MKQETHKINPEIVPVLKQLIENKKNIMIMKKYVYVLTRTEDGDAIVDGVFTTEKKAEDYRNQQLKDFGEDLEEWENGGTEYDYEIHREELQ